MRPLARLAFALPLVLGAACSSEPVRLYLLREADPGTPQREAYGRLEEAVELANAFLHESRYAPLFPAEKATFRLGMTDVLLELQGERTEVLRIETSGWGDVRTAVGDRIQTTDQGFVTDTVTDPARSTGDPALDNLFLQLPAEEMAAILLRQGAALRELHARGSTDYWVNYHLLGLWPGNGFGKDNPVERRPYAVELAFRTWLAEERGRPPAGAEDAGGSSAGEG